MDEREMRARRRARAEACHFGGPMRRAAGYAAILLAGISLAAMIFPERAAQAEKQPQPGAANRAAGVAPARPPGTEIAQAGRHSGPRGTSFNQKEAADLANQAYDAALRCDRAATDRHVTNMGRLRQSLLQAEASGVVQGAGEDANALLAARSYISSALTNDCPPKALVVRAIDEGMVYGFYDGANRENVQRLIDKAEAAVKNCDKDAYYDAVAELRTLVESINRAAQLTEGSAPKHAADLRRDAARISAMVEHLVRTGDARFRNCTPPRAAAPPAPPTGPRTNVPPPPPDTAAPPAGPQRPVGLPFTPGFVIEPWVAVTVRFNDAEGEYSSDGGQAPGAGKGDKTQGNFCGGAEFRMRLFDLANIAAMQGVESFMLGATEAGLRFGVCELGSGEKVAFSEIRHGADGAVTLSERERTEIMLLFMLQQYFYIDVASMFGQNQSGSRGDQYAAADLAQAPGMRARNWWPFAVYFGVGPSFVRTTISMTSNQVPGGGVFEAASQRRWDTGVSFVVGGKTALCRDCAFGSPVMFGIEGQWTHLPARNVAVTSSTFGFTESGRVSGRTASRLTFKVSVPFGIGR